MTQSEVEAGYESLNSSQAEEISEMRTNEGDGTAVNNATGSGYSGDLTDLFNGMFGLSNIGSAIANINASGKNSTGRIKCPVC